MDKPIEQMARELAEREAIGMEYEELCELLLYGTTGWIDMQKEELIEYYDNLIKPIEVEDE